MLTPWHHEKFWFKISAASHESVWIFKHSNLTCLDTCTCSWLILAPGNELTWDLPVSEAWKVLSYLSQSICLGHFMNSNGSVVRCFRRLYKLYRESFLIVPWIVVRSSWMLVRPQATFKQYLSLRYNLGSMIDMEKLRRTHRRFFWFCGCTVYQLHYS